MTTPISIFLDFNLPNATTWLYFSFLLAVALFFKFSRLLSMRNWDIVLLFLLAPGLLLIHGNRADVSQAALKIGSLVGQEAGPGQAMARQIGAVLPLVHDSGT